VVVPLRRLNAATLRKAIVQVLQDVKYREAAQGLQSTIRRMDGLGRAADLIDQVLNSVRLRAEPELREL
jgi:UDP:flavonoid glycosyltransferase YjiC (YdhE family)